MNKVIFMSCSDKPALRISNAKLEIRYEAKTRTMRIVVNDSTIILAEHISELIMEA